MNEKSELLLHKRREQSSRSCCATCCHCYSVVIYFSILLCAVFYLGYFVHLDIEIDSSDSVLYTDGCILFGDLAQTEDEFVLDQNISCDLSIYGSCVLIIFILLLLVLAIFSSILGRW